MSETEHRTVYVERSVIVGENGKILFLQRSEDDPHEPGYWELPGGKTDEGEEAEAARYREIKEETGLDTQQIFPDLTDLQVSDGVHHSGEVRRYHARTTFAKQIGGLLKISHEHSDSAWMLPAEAIVELDLTEPCKIALRAFFPHLFQQEKS